MLIDLKRLKGTNQSLSFEEKLCLQDEVIYGERPLQQPIFAKGELSREHDILRMRATVRGLYQTHCARCLAPLDILLSAEIDTILSDDAQAEEDDDLFVLQGDTLDTKEVLVPALLLQIEMTYLCSEDCKGLCPRCGVDLNKTGCACKTTAADPRFAALYALLEQDKAD